MLVYCQVHVFAGLEIAIDSYCMRFTCEGNLTQSMNEWNLLQAILRRSSRTLEACFMVVATSALGAVMLNGREVWSAEPESISFIDACLWFGWVLPSAGLLVYMVLRAAVITEKCSRVPSLANSWISSSSVTDSQERHYFV